MVSGGGAADGPASTRQIGHGEWPLTGRSEELEFIERTLGESRRHGVLLAGAPGVGKSRLARAVADHAREKGWRTEHVAATESTRDLPMAAVLHLLPEHVEMTTSRTEMLRRAAAGLAARSEQQSLIIILDDAHLLDVLSASLLHHLVTSQLCSLIATTRSGETLPEPISRLYKDGLVERLEVQQLALLEVRDLLDAVLGGQVGEDTLRRLWSVSGGNVLYLHELILDALDAGSLREQSGIWRWSGSLGDTPRLAEVVGSRLSGLAGSELKLLELLAIGEPLPVAILERLPAGGAVANLERNKLVEARDTAAGLEVRLSHPLYGEVLRRQLPTLEERRLSRELADAFAASGPLNQRDSLRLAVWRVKSGSQEDAAVVAAAAENANRMGDALTAERLALVALDTAWSFRAALQLGAALYEQGRFAEAAEALASLGNRAPDDQARQDLAYCQMRVLFYGLGRLDDACAALESAEASIGDERRRETVRGWRAVVLSHGGRLDQAADLAAALRTVGSPKARAAASATLMTARLFGGRVREALTLSEECVALARRGDRVPIMAASARVLALHGDCRIAEAEQLLNAAIGEEGEAARSPGDVAVATALSGAGALLAGQPATALRRLREAAVLLRAHDEGGFLGWSLSLQAESAALLGDAAGSTAAAEEAASHADAGMRLFEADCDRARLWARAARGDWTGAAGELSRLADTLAGSGIWTVALRAQHDAIRLGAGGRHLATLAELASKVDSRLGQATLHQSRALLDRDLAGLEGAALEYEAAEATLLAAETWAQSSRLAAESGLAARAAAARRRQVELVMQCEGAKTPVLITEQDAPNLTRREREVATLAATGLSNRQIAEQLVTSVRTVEGHLYQAFSKLGVTTREELPELLGGL